MLNLSVCIQNRRGGRVQLATITAPQSEYENEEKGEVRLQAPSDHVLITDTLAAQCLLCCAC